MLVRSLGFFVAGPIFSQRGIPAQIKLLLGLATAVALFPLVPPGTLPATSLGGFLFAIAGETFIGVFLAFGASLPFISIRVGASLLGIQMGFGIVNVMDPSHGGQSPIIARFYEIAALMAFLLLNGHHLLLRALGLSLRAIPIGGASLSLSVAGQLLAMAGSLFVLALAVGGPLVAVLFLTDAAMGFVARTVPQMNIFIVGFPIKIGLGLFGIAVTLPIFFRTIERILPGLERDLLTLLSGM